LIKTNDLEILELGVIAYILRVSNKWTIDLSIYIIRLCWEWKQQLKQNYTAAKKILPKGLTVVHINNCFAINFSFMVTGFARSIWVIEQ